MKTTNKIPGPLSLSIVARALVPFFVAHVAASRAYHMPHINQIKAAGGRKAHGDATFPRYARAKSSLVRALKRPEVETQDKRAAFAVANDICKSEFKSRERGLSWDADAAVDAWLHSA